MAAPASSSGDQEALLVSSLQAASQSWISFDWNGKRTEWESTLTQSKEAREQSLAARKQLAETTKQFKRAVKGVEQACATLQSTGSSENVASTVKAVEGLTKQGRQTVKSYQEEIDNLTRRCKSSESAFSSLFQSLSEVPDPASVVSAALEHTSSKQAQVNQLLRALDEANKEMDKLRESNKTSSGGGLSRGEREELLQLRREVTEYEVEFKNLKNQDITIRKLEARIVELQTAGEEELKEKLEKAQQELAETEGRRAAEALEREAAMERKVQTLELQLKAERAGREATQAHLLEADEGAGEREAAWEAQRRILVDDAERLRETLHEAARERDELRLRVAALEGNGGNTRPSPSSGGIPMADMMLERKAFEAEVSELSHTANALREEIRVKDEIMAEERRTLQASIDSLEMEKGKLNSALTSLEAQLAAAPSQSVVDSMKRELRILKRLEYNADDADTDRDPEMTGGSVSEEKDLESVLVAKLRRLESDLVKERNAKSDHATQCENLRKELASATKARQEADKLIAALEADLDRAITTPVSPGPSKTRKTIDPDVIVNENPATLQSILDPSAPPPDPVVSESAPAPKASATEKAEDDHSVATIVMAQRDRLRARCDALEAERDSFKKELQAQVSASESLKADNTKLYEKVRYLQNFSSGPPSSRGGQFGRKALQDRDLDLEALEQRYEASVDPFRQFSRAERQRKLKEMSPMERTVFIVAKTVLGTKEMRTALFFYVVAMHLLVFITTYHWSHNDSGCMMNIDKDHLAHLPPMVNAVSKGAVESAAAGAN